jgi:hypothetical protein
MQILEPYISNKSDMELCNVSEYIANQPNNIYVKTDLAKQIFKYYNQQVLSLERNPLTEDMNLLNRKRLYVKC